MYIYIYIYLVLAAIDKNGVFAVTRTKQTVSCTIDNAILDRINHDRGTGSTSAFVNSILREHYKRGQNNEQ